MMSTSAAPPLTCRRPLLLLTAIVLLGAGLRLPGNFYPVALHYDEGVYIANILCRPSPNGTFYHPFLSRYLLRFAEAGPCVAAWLRHAPHPGTETDAAFASNPTPFLYLGRSLSLLFGLLTIVAVYLLGSALAGAPTGLAAALLLALMPTNITLSNNLGPWCLATLMSSLVFLCLARLQDTVTARRPLVLLGIALGCAIATVYPLALLLVPVTMRLVSRWRGRVRDGQPSLWQGELLTVAATALVVHAITNLTALTHPMITLKELFVPEASLFSADSSKVTYLDNLRWHLDSAFDRLGPTWTIGVLGIAGLLIAAALLRGLWLGMLAFTAAILVLQPAAVVLMANRYTGPITPLLAVAAAWLIVAGSARLLQNMTGAARRFALPAALVALALVPSILTDRAYLAALALPPTRLQALAWIEAHIPAGSKLLQSIRYMNPPALNCEFSSLLKDPALAGRPCYRVTYAPIDPDLYSDAFLDYLAKSDSEYLVFGLVTPPGTVTRLHRVRRTSPVLQQRYTLLARFEHPGLEQFYDDTTVVNPAVEIYRLAR